MDLWKIFFLGTVRLCCGWNNGKLQDNADNHKKLRQMLGHSKMDHDILNPLKTYGGINSLGGVNRKNSGVQQPQKGKDD